MAIHYDNDTVKQIRNMDMIDFFRNYKGFTFKKQGADYRCNEHNSLIVKGDRKRWYWNSQSVGGAGIIDYLIKVENFTFQNAIATVLNTSCSIIPAGISEAPITKDFLCLPEKGAFPYIKLIQYLCTNRHIDSRIVLSLVKAEKLYQDSRGNAVFIGNDEAGKPRYATIRGTGAKLFRMDCKGSDKRYSFSLIGKDNKSIYIFESPIDALSHATMENITFNDSKAWKNTSRISLGGTSSVALESYLKRNGKVRQLILCLDNDESGREAMKRIKDKYSPKGYDISVSLPKGKDYNEDLIAQCAVNKVKKAIQNVR